MAGLIGLTRAHADPQFTILDLGSLGGGTNSQAFDINNAGQVIGASQTSSGATLAFLTSPGSAIDPATDALGVLMGGTTSHAYSINSMTNVVGDGDTFSGDRAYRYSNGVMTSLGTLGGGWSYAYGINDSNQIVGGSANLPGPFAHTHAFLYSGARMSDLGTLGAPDGEFDSYARAINKNGVAVGYSSYDPVSYWNNHAFVWTPTSPNAATGSMADLGTLGGLESYAWNINDRSQIVGGANTDQDLGYHAFRSWNGTKIDLGTLGATYSEAFDVNLNGEIVGASDATAGSAHAFLYTNGAMYDLNAAIPSGSGWTLQSARAINDSGQIVGYGINALGQTHAFLLTPTNRPSYWNVDAGGNWSQTPDWTGGIVPSTAGQTAEFSNAITEPRMVMLDQPVTVGGLTFDNPGASYTIGSASATLTLDTASAQPARITVVSGSHTILAPLMVNQNLDVTVAMPSSVLTLTGDASYTPGVGVTKDGPGTARFKNVRAQSLAINQGTAAILAGRSTAGTSRVESLSIAGTIDAWTAALDVNDQDLIVDYAGPSPLAVIANQIKSGYAAGAWNGNGIRSSASAASNATRHRTALGYGEASTLALTTFSGQSVDDTAVLVRYTYNGDANLDGSVDTLDFNALAGNFGQTGKLWTQADFNYDGVVDTLDFNSLAANFGQVMPGSAVAPSAVVPEPGALTSTALMLVLIRLHRRRPRS